MNLNKVNIETDGWLPMRTKDNSAFICGTSDVHVVFRDLQSAVCTAIKRADFVVGCVAWMTNEKIIEALAGVSWGCSIVVQKEDWLRPDASNSAGWAKTLRSRYDKLSCYLDRNSSAFCKSIVGELSTLGDASINPVRCAGNHNSKKHPAFPRMHNKFLVFCKGFCRTKDGVSEEEIVPFAVWTGSYNMTDNAEESLENAVIIHDTDVADAYFHEWEQILAISEPLDWNSEWCVPQWRIGT